MKKNSGSAFVTDTTSYPTKREAFQCAPSLSLHDTVDSNIRKMVDASLWEFMGSVIHGS
jgi:hypothetical protein